MKNTCTVIESAQRLGQISLHQFPRNSNAKMSRSLTLLVYKGISLGPAYKRGCYFKDFGETNSSDPDIALVHQICLVCIIFVL